MPNPLPRAKFVTLSSVTAISASDVWALGLAAHGGTTVPYALHWDGSAWTTMDLPQPGGDTRYTSISGSSADDIWAVGRVIGQQVFTEHWDGTEWTDVPFPHQYAATLEAATTLPDGDAWAVGDYLAGQHPVILTPLIGFWDGTSWTVQEAEGGAAHQSYLSAVGSSPDDVWAVGNAGAKALIRHWDGTEWL